MVKQGLAQATLDGYIVKTPVASQDRLFVSGGSEAAVIDTEDDVPARQPVRVVDLEPDWSDEGNDSEARPCLGQPELYTTTAWGLFFPGASRPKRHLEISQMMRNGNS